MTSPDSENDPVHPDAANDSRPKSDSSVGEDSDASQSEDEEGLPEWEPLTPELVEDEALRGDFVLRWAVILLALLLGCTKISETSTLVHIKSGEYMAGHGVLPPRTDVFSYTAADRPWINLGWLFDLIAAGVFAVGGAVGISLFKAVLAAMVVGIVVHTSKPEIATWWGSVCAGLALLVWYPQFTMRPEIVTLLGLAVTFWLLNRWKEEQNSTHLWLLVPVFLLWSNLDPRLFLGLSLLLLYAAGRSAGVILSGSSTADQPLVKQLWIVVGACFLVSLINPFGWHALAAPFTLYGVEYPAFQDHFKEVRPLEQLQYFPLTNSELWDFFNHRILAGLFLLMVPAVTFVLNWERVDYGQMLVYLGFIGFSIIGIHELAPAAIVCTVIATLNAQEWYKATFRQTYSVEFSELLFSRGGRAITVLGIFSFAYLSISGILAKIEGPGGQRTGIGFHHELQTHFEGLQTDLEGSFDNKPFNFRLDQGDILIWAGQKVFVDSRVAIYHGDGDEDLLNIHNKTREALQKTNPVQQQKNQSLIQTSVQNQPQIPYPDVWQKTLDRFGITHVLPRLSQPKPDYTTYYALYISPDWQLTQLGASTASFYRTDLTKREHENYDPQLEQYVSDHQINFLNQAFRSKKIETEQRAIWPHAPSVYQKYLSLPQTTASEDLWLADHYGFHVELISIGKIRFSQDFFSFAYLAIRKANAVLENDPQNVTAYRILGRIYNVLEQFERIFAGGQGEAIASLRRYSQTVQSYSQALIIEPDHLPTLRRLSKVYENHNKLDLALEILDRIEALTPDRTQSEIESRKKLSDPFNTFTEQLEEGKKKGALPLQIANAAYQNGCVLHTLKILDEDPELLFENPQTQVFHAFLLMEAGRIKEASDSMERLVAVVERFPNLKWRSQAAILSLANARYPRAASLWREEALQQQEQRLGTMLDMLPFVSPIPEYLDRYAGLSWPLQQTMSSVKTLIQDPANSIRLLFDSALCHLERGDNQTAESQLRQILEIDPETQLRQIVITYLHLITDERFEIEPPSMRIPISRDMFAHDKNSQQSPAKEPPGK
jgi:tetratricopeptide (TPR) repeat protein